MRSGAAVAAVLCATLVPVAARAQATYFPLRPGNWWAYEELADDGTTLSRETWTVLDTAPADRAGEYHVRSFTKRLDLLGHGGHRWEGHEFLHATAGGLRKRYPARGRDGELEVTLLMEPVDSGTRWHDAQGDCEVTARGPCATPREEVPDCAITVCRLGRPTATVVTSVYARGIGMVRQEVQVLQFLPALHGTGAMPVPYDSTKGGHSVLRLVAFHVTAP